MKPELNPCPFCVGTNNYVRVEQLQKYDPSMMYYVECDSCGTEGPVCDTEEDAIEKWNRRAQPAEPVNLPSDYYLRGMWVAAGGRFHGPNIETGTMPEAQLLPFLRRFVTGQAAAEPGKVPSDEEIITNTQNENH